MICCGSGSDFEKVLVLVPFRFCIQTIFFSTVFQFSESWPHFLTFLFHFMLYPDPNPEPDLEPNPEPDPALRRQEVTVSAVPVPVPQH
jgi:hypothetical protein